MKLSIVHVAVLAASLALVVQPAVAENRVALVFGQSAYRLVPTLPNPANDAKMMAGLLTSAGFEVTAVPDASQTEMRKAIADFVEKLNEKGTDTVALVYYAGHGLQVDGENFLLPVDVSVLHESDVPLQGVRLNDLLNSLALVPSKTRIIMLDACRDNPFPDLEKTIGHGLALLDTKAGSTGSFISFSTSPGAVAEDGTGADSPYTTALLTAAREHGLTIEEALKRVRVSVNQATDGRQTPWDSSSLTTDFYFFPGQEAAHALQTTGERTAQGWRRSLQALQPKVAYERVIAEDTVEAYEAFLVLFVGSPFASRVHDLLDRRREMVAWAAAVALNTPESYEAFLASYPTSDLAATARKLRERTRNRLQVAALGQASIPISGAATGAGGAGGLGSATAATSVVSAVPMCPCVLPPPTPLTIPPFKHVDTPPQKHVDTPSPPPPQKHVDISPPPPNVNPPKVVVQQPDSPPPLKKSKVFLPSDTPPQKHVDTPSPPPPQKHVDISPPPPIVNSPKVVVQQPDSPPPPKKSKVFLPSDTPPKVAVQQPTTSGIDLGGVIGAAIGGFGGGLAAGPHRGSIGGVPAMPLPTHPGPVSVPAMPPPMHGPGSVPAMPLPTHPGPVSVPAVPPPMHGPVSVPAMPPPMHGPVSVPAMPPPMHGPVSVPAMSPPTPPVVVK